MKRSRLYLSTLALATVCLSLTVSACDAQSSKPKAVALTDDNSIIPEQTTAQDKLQQNVDPIPVPTAKPMVISNEDIKVQGQPACAFTIRYPEKTDQEVTWAKEPCSAVTTDFLTIDALKKLGKLDRLSGEALEDVKRHGTTGVFYVESQFTASIFPLNVAGIAYELPIAD
jgi:hypothetical protein